MASNNDYDPDLSGDTLTATKAKQKQTLFDQTNLPQQYQTQGLAQAAPAGPIARATQQLPTTPEASTGQSLADAYQPGRGGGAAYSGVGSQGETSFSQFPSSLESLSPGFSNQQPDQRQAPQASEMSQAWKSTTQPSNAAPTSLEDLTPGGRSVDSAPNPVASLADASLTATPSQTYTSLDQIAPSGAPAQAQANQSVRSLADLSPGGPTITPAPPSAQQQSLADAWQSGQPSSGSRQTNTPSNGPQAGQPPQFRDLNSLTPVSPVGVLPTPTSPTYPTTSQQAGGLSAEQAASAAKAQSTISRGATAAAKLVAPQPAGQPAPIGILPTATSPTYPTGRQVAPQQANQAPQSDPNSEAQQAPQPPSGYQQTGIGSGSNQIAMKIGDDGVPTFTNDATAVAGAAPVSVNQANRVSPTDSNQSLASLGSAKNMYDGIGQFSQAEAGDAQLSMGRFQKAADLRDAYKAQDRLAQAQGEKWQADHTNVVHDSSRPITQRELKTDAEYAGMKDRAAKNVDLAQGYLSDQQANQQTGMQLRQAQRLEDALTMAIAPNATSEQKQAYQALTDPTNEKGLAREFTQAKINEANASADKQRNSISKTGNLPVALQKLEDGDIDAVSNVQSTNTQLGNILGQLDNGSLVLGPIENKKNAALNAAGRSNPQSVNYASFMSSLEQIRNANLRLNKGTQTEGDANRAWNELLANVNDPKVVKQRLQEIQVMNTKAAQTKLGMINSRRKNQGVAPLNIEDILGSSPQPSQAAQPQQSGGTAASAQQAGQGVAAKAPTTPQIKNDDDYNKLPSGTQFIDPQGMHRRKP